MSRARTVRLTAAALAALVILTALATLPAPGVGAETAWDDAALNVLTAEELVALRGRIDDRLRALGEYPFVKLSEGSRGDEVTALQRRLKALGYFTAEPDGRYRTTTVNAMKAFEKAAGLRRDGVASVEDQAALFADAAPAAPTPTPSPTPKPTRTPNRAKDYGKLDYRLAGLMPDKYFGSRYKLSGEIMAFLDGDTKWLITLDDASAGLIAVQGFSAARSAGDRVTVWGEYLGLTQYESESGPVSVLLFNCEYME